MELLFVVIVGLAIWYLWPRKRGPRRSPAALERERREGPSRADMFPAPDGPTTTGIYSSISLTSDISKMGPPKDGRYSFEIEYLDRNGSSSKRLIGWPSFRHDGKDTLITAYCSLRQDERTFRASRIVSCRNLETGRQIKDLGQWLRRFR